ncbi:MAG: hypothetical protein QFX36_07730 [Archaeoglobales archaeon]|nr:hypothetical protein [Archaeoglobales archaeon]MDI9641917.1 hypothetical protein [Archaeoglobales archaeon]
MGLIEGLKLRVAGEIGDSKKSSKLLVFLYYFEQENIKEVSVTELLDAIKMAQERIDFGYKFSDKILYSSTVFDEIERLKNEGYLKKYSYKYNGYFPMNYVALTTSGLIKSKEITDSLQENELEVIRSSVKQAIENLRERYKIWIRKIPKRKTFL